MFSTSKCGTICTSNTGAITTGSADVYINGRPSARASLSEVYCAKHPGGPPLVAEGSSSVYINDMPASRVGDHSTCGGKINASSANVFIGGQAEPTEEIDDEVPRWLHVAIAAIGISSAVFLFGPALAVLGLAGGVVGGTVAHHKGGEWFGEGSDGQKLTALGGAILGGAIAGGGGKCFNARYQLKVKVVPQKPTFSRLSQKEIELARTPGASFKQTRARRKVVEIFQEDMGVPQKQRNNMNSGIDFNKPIKIENFKKGNTLVQWYKSRMGNWFDPIGDQPPTKLGISDVGRKKLSVKMEHDGYALESAARKVNDTWTNPPNSYPTEGGGKQWFIPDQYLSGLT